MKKRQGYIHIKEAVKVFNRTRQTFYNYINKGLVDTKKVNNKVYLKIADIEKLLSAYLPKEGDTEQEDEQPVDKETSDKLVQHIKELEGSLSTTQKKVGKLEEKLHDEVAMIKDDLIIETKNLLYRHYEELKQSQIDLVNEIATKLGNRTPDNSAYLATKKYQFYLGYLGFVAINLIILGFLF